MAVAAPQYFRCSPVWTAGHVQGPCGPRSRPGLLVHVPRRAPRARARTLLRAVDPVMGRVGRQAIVGAMGAVVAALLQAFTEPVLNRVAVKRMTLAEAVREVRLIDILRFFRTVLATNLLKFPFFEAVNAFSSTWTSVPAPLQGVFAAVIYTSAVLPLANYRYIQSLQLQVKFRKLYQAYLPTLLRDLIYGVTRMWMMRKLIPLSPPSPRGDAVKVFVSIIVACLASAPGNELRAYRLQPRESRLPPGQFFELRPFLRSAVLGALIPATAIAAGQFLVGEAEVLSNMLHLGALWLVQPHGLWVPVLLLVLWAVLKLESTRQYYDPYAQSRMLQRLRNDLQSSRSKRAASYATSDPGLIVQAIESDIRTNAPEVPSALEIARFVAPSCCLVVANSSMTSVDKAFLGRSSSLQLAAMGPAASVFDSSSFLLTFLNTATLSLLGMANDPETLRKIRSHAVFLATGSGLLLGALLCGFARQLTHLMGATAVMLPYSVAYLQIRALGAPIERGTSVATSFCLAAKDGSTPLLVTLLGLVTNIILDGLLCPRYGLVGVAVASVLASALGYAYLIRALLKTQRWPRPFSWPRRGRSLLRFLRFAGPVLFAVFLKTMVLATMTSAACAFGTTAAASQQLFQTLFLLSAVALGNPCSWAAQAYLPPLLSAYCQGKEPEASGGSRRSVQTLAKLLGCALGASSVAAGLVVLFCHRLAWILSNDPQVLAAMAEGSAALVPFLALYPLLLTLEGALYGAQERGLVLRLSILFWVMSCLSIHFLRAWGKLTLSSMWLAVGISCGVSTLVTAFFAFRVLLVPKCYLILGNHK